jgi:hypothetical protein
MPSVCYYIKLLLHQQYRLWMALNNVMSSWEPMSRSYAPAIGSSLASEPRAKLLDCSSEVLFGGVYISRHGKAR